MQPRDLPEYLKDSAFFGNLSDDDEEVSVPIDCCKHDTSVTNAADLQELLRTLRFWGVDRIPITVIEFILSSHYDVWGTVVENFVRDLSFVADLLQVVKCDREQRVCAATETGNVEIITYLLERNYPVEYTVFECFSRKETRAVDIAAKIGNLDILKILKLHNCSYHQDTGNNAALGGHLAALDYIMKNGCPVSDDLLNYAFAGGSLECLKYLRETVGCKWSNNIFYELNYFLHHKNKYCEEEKLLQCLQYALTHGCSPEIPRGCDLCAHCGYASMLALLHESGCFWDEQVPLIAARKGHLSCLQYVMDNECPLPDNLFEAAMLSGSEEMVQFLHDRGLPWPVKALLELRFDDEDKAEKAKVSITYAYKLGCAPDPDTWLFACRYGWYDLLVDTHEHNRIPYTSATQQVARWGHLKCLIYLHENGCPWDEQLTTCALAYKKYGCLKYAIEHGCPATKATMNKFKLLVENGTVI